MKSILLLVCLAASTTAVSTPEQSGTRGYSMPSHETLTVELPAGISGGQVLLTDLYGRTLTQQRISGQLTIPAGNLPAGTYFLHISTEAGQYWTQKVQKCR